MPESTRPPGSSTRGPLPSHSQAQIVDAAIAIADRDGLAATTVRAVAASLGLAPAALYRYVPSRSRLVEHMVDAALAHLEPPRPSGDPIADLVALVVQQVAALRRHPWLVDTMQAVPPGPEALRVLDAGLRLLDPVAVGGAAKLETLAMLTGVATLFARASVEPDPRTVLAFTAAAATHDGIAAAFADPGTASTPEALLRRTAEAMARGLLGLDRG